MAVDSIDDILTAKDRDTLLAEILAILAADGCPVTAWQTGNPLRTLAKADARPSRTCTRPCRRSVPRPSSTTPRATG